MTLQLNKDTITAYYTASQPTLGCWCAPDLKPHVSRPALREKPGIGGTLLQGRPTYTASSKALQVKLSGLLNTALSQRKRSRKGKKKEQETKRPKRELGRQRVAAGSSHTGSFNPKHQQALLSTYFPWGPAAGRRPVTKV